MHISTRDLEAFIALADLHSFTRAAARCHLSQSAFSTRISSIERALGARLFDRTTRLVELTQAGDLFLESACRLHGEFVELLADFRDHAQRRKGRVAIAALPSISAAWLPAMLGQFHTEHPGIKLTLHDTLADNCIALLRAGSVDFAIASRPAEGEDMEAHKLAEEKFFLVCGVGHVLARKPRLKLRDLQSHAFIHLTRDSSVRQNIERAFHPQQMQSFLQVEHLATVAGLVQAGLGITVVPELTLFEFNRLGLVIRPLKLPDLSRSIYLLRRRAKTLSFAAETLYERISVAGGTIHDHLRGQVQSATE